jgi:hypothetical protein
VLRDEPAQVGEFLIRLVEVPRAGCRVVRAIIMAPGRADSSPGPPAWRQEVPPSIGPPIAGSDAWGGAEGAFAALARPGSAKGPMDILPSPDALSPYPKEI